MITIPSRRIGIFGGTFDPIHLGHLILAERAFEQLALDQLIFIPAYISPYKLEVPPNTSPEKRVAMIQLAIKDRPSWSVDQREVFREGPSFTIDTLQELREEHKGATFFFFIGEDQLEKLSGWKESERLQSVVSFVVLSRKLKQEAPKITAPFRFLEHAIDISSTDIRERLAKKKNVDYLLPCTVHDYIKKHHLYQKNNS